MAALRFSLALLAMIAGGTAHAEVRQSAADSFLVAFSAPVRATPAKAWAQIAQVQHWWSSEHTWSGQAANLSLKAEAGACFCERWPGGSAEHGRVIMAVPDKLLRLDAALGPLQEFALNGVLSFWLKHDDDGATVLDVEYRVNGTSSSGLDQFAPQVDAVLGEQVARLARYIDTGNPERVPVAAAPAQSPDGARAAILEAWKQSAAPAQAPAASKSKQAKPKTPKPKAADGP